MKIVVLVKNSFTNDARVDKICKSLSNNNNNVYLLAEKTFMQLPIIQITDFVLIRVPVFSSLYAQKKTFKKSKSNDDSQNSIIKKIYILFKQNKIRMYLTSFLNSVFYNLGSLLIGISIKPEIVYANDLNTLLAGYVIAKIMKAKLIYDSHEIWLEGTEYNKATRLKRYLWILIERHIIRRTDNIIVTTQMRADFLQEKYDLSKVIVVRNCSPFQIIKPKNRIRKEFGISNSTPILIYQGLLNIERGILTLVDIVKAIPDIALFIIGHGNHTEELVNYINENNLSERIIVKDSVGYQELLEYTASADIGLQLLKNVCFNHYSTISNKVFEYIMSGIAIVASDFPEIRNIIETYNLGNVVNPDDKKQIKDAILKILSGDNLSNLKQNSANARYENSWEYEEKKLIGVLNSCRNY
jgi:glycosyltransferase involved in cell wall biosynthesis